MTYFIFSYSNLSPTLRRIQKSQSLIIRLRDGPLEKLLEEWGKNKKKFMQGKIPRKKFVPGRR